MPSTVKDFSDMCPSKEVRPLVIPGVVLDERVTYTPSFDVRTNLFAETHQLPTQKQVNRYIKVKEVAKYRKASARDAFMIAPEAGQTVYAHAQALTRRSTYEHCPVYGCKTILEEEEKPAEVSSETQTSNVNGDSEAWKELQKSLQNFVTIFNVASPHAKHEHVEEMLKTYIGNRDSGMRVSDAGSVN